MELNLSLALFGALVAAVAITRLVELGISQRRRRALFARGAPAVPERHFGAMVALHAGVLAAALLEAHLGRRPMIPALALAAALLVVLANALRWWTITTLGPHWNVRVIDSTALGVVSSGPFRWIRHPNYLAVFVELAALPLVHSAYATALLGTAAHIWVLRQRIVAEEAVLLADAGYRTRLGDKPRFLPWPRRTPWRSG